MLTSIGPASTPFNFPVFNVFLDVVGSEAIWISASDDFIFTTTDCLVVLPMFVTASNVYFPLSVTLNVNTSPAL